MCERREGRLGHRVRERALGGEAPDLVDLRELSAGAVVVERTQSLEVDPSVDQTRGDVVQADNLRFEPCSNRPGGCERDLPRPSRIAPIDARPSTWQHVLTIAGMTSERQWEQLAARSQPPGL
jgi:hypothetical protein